MSEMRCPDCIAWAWSNKFQRCICRITDAATEEHCHCPELREAEARRMLSPADREALEVGYAAKSLLKLIYDAWAEAHPLAAGPPEGEPDKWLAEALRAAKKAGE